MVHVPAWVDPQTATAVLLPVLTSARSIWMTIAMTLDAAKASEPDPSRSRRVTNLSSVSLLGQFAPSPMLMPPSCGAKTDIAVSNPEALKNAGSERRPANTFTLPVGEVTPAVLLGSPVTYSLAVPPVATQHCTLVFEANRQITWVSVPVVSLRPILGLLVR